MVAIPDHLVPTTFPLAQTVRTVRCLKVKRGTTPEMVLDPDYWVHAGGTIKVDDQIEVIAQDGSFFLSLLVTAVDVRGYWAHTLVLNRIDIARDEKKTVPRAGDDEDGYRIEWSGSPVHRWRIIDRAGEVVASRFPTEDAAIKQLAEIKREKIAA